MRVIRIGVSTFAALVSLGLLFFLYLFPAGGLVGGLLEVDTASSTLRDVAMTTTLAALNVLAAVLLLPKMPKKAALIRVLGFTLIVLGLLDGMLGLLATSSREAWIPWLDLLSIINGCFLNLERGATEARARQRAA